MIQKSQQSQPSQVSRLSQPSQILEGSRAIALTIKNIKPAVVSAYPITPQTHIIEDLAGFKAQGQADYEYIRAESEFAAASIIAGASATGVRVYSATSSQGLLLMTEVLFNIAGMRLPVVMTCANRAVSAPINIWNDQQDVMVIRDAGWILLFAENHQETVSQHIMAYKIAEQLKLPVMVNVDGFLITHTYEPVVIPTAEQIKKYLPDYQPKPGDYLDPKNPVTFGHLAAPSHYMEIRQQLHDDLIASLKVINQEYDKYHSVILEGAKRPIGSRSKYREQRDSIASGSRMTGVGNGLLEYYGQRNAKIILISMGSVIGTIKDVVDEHNSTPPLNLPLRLVPIVASGKGEKQRGYKGEVAVLKIKCFRPFPAEEILKTLKQAKYIAVIDKSISLGHLGTLASDIKAVAQGKINAKIQSFIVGLGGRDVTKQMIKKIIIEVTGRSEGMKFIGKI